MEGAGQDKKRHLRQMTSLSASLEKLSIHPSNKYSLSPVCYTPGIK